MLEYLFFDAAIRDKFVAFLEEHKVEFRLNDDDESLIAEVPEDLDEELADAIDECYEKLLQETAELLEQTDDAMEKNVAGVQVQLGDGTICTVRLDPDLVGRILNCISMAELRDMVQEVALWVERRDNSPLCHVVDLEK